MRRKSLVAALVASSLVMPITVVRADNLGCTFMLCMAGSGASHWKKISECVKPVRKVLRKMLRGDYRPHCSLVSSAGDVDSGSYMKIRHERYLACGEAYTPSHRDAYFTRNNALAYGTSAGSGLFGGSIGGPKCAAEVSREPWTNGRAPAKTANYCVDETTNNRGGSRGFPGVYGSNKVRVCTDVQPKLEHESPDFVDVYVDGAFYTRTYWTEGDAMTEEELALEE